MLTRLVGLSLLCVCTLARAQDLATCGAIDDDAKRLRCYDALAGRSPPEAPPATQPELRYRWEKHLLDEATRETFTLQGYQPAYALVTQLSSFNYAPYREVDPDNNLSRAEIKFGFSLQTKVIDDLFGNDGDVWFAYTQTSFWQLLNTRLSSPFRETDYNPEVRMAFLTRVQLAGLTLRNVSFGLRHDSNGQSGTLSRSWNRLFANFQITRGSLIVSLRPWVRVFDVEDNPDIEKYYGHFDVRASWERGNQLFSLTLRNPLDHRYGAELNWSLPISGGLRGLVQWQYGYSENLIDYNHRNNRIGVGLLLSDWL